MTIAWSDCELRVSSCTACCSPSISRFAVRASTAVRWITSSPIECMSASRRSASTRTVRVWVVLTVASAGAGARLAGSTACGAGGPSDVGAGWSPTRGDGGHLDREDLRHGADVRGDRLVFVIARDPRVDLASLELLDAVGRRRARENLAVVRERCQHHVCADGRHQNLGAQRDTHAEHAGTGLLGGDDRSMVKRVRDPYPSHLLLRRAWPDERPQPRDQRGRIERLVAVGLDRLGRRGQGVQACEHRVDGFDRQPGGPLAEKLEHVLHLVRQLGDPAEAHRRAHALQRVGDSEYLIDGRTIRGVLLEADNDEIQLFEVLARLGHEHRHVLGGIHHDFR